MEDALCSAFKSLGFEVTPIGGKGRPDGIATALLSADDKGRPRQYAVSLEAKSKEKDKGKVAAGTVKVSAVIRQRNDYKCQHALVVGRAFPTSTGNDSALAKEIDDDRKNTAALGESKTITLITIDDLARLVRLRPVKQVGLQKMRELFEQCRLPEESNEWVNSTFTLRTRSLRTTLPEKMRVTLSSSASRLFAFSLSVLISTAPPGSPRTL